MESLIYAPYIKITDAENTVRPVIVVHGANLLENVWQKMHAHMHIPSMSLSAFFVQSANWDNQGSQMESVCIYVRMCVFIRIYDIQNVCGKQIPFK